MKQFYFYTNLLHTGILTKFYQKRRQKPVFFQQIYLRHHIRRHLPVKNIYFCVFSTHYILFHMKQQIKRPVFAGIFYLFIICTTKPSPVFDGNKL